MLLTKSLIEQVLSVNYTDQFLIKIAAILNKAGVDICYSNLVALGYYKCDDSFTYKPSKAVDGATVDIKQLVQLSAQIISFIMSASSIPDESKLELSGSITTSRYELLLPISLICLIESRGN